MSIVEPTRADVPSDAGNPAGPSEPAPAGADPGPRVELPLPSPSEFLAGLSAGLHAPMNRITTLSRLMGEAGLPPAQQRVARQICASAEGLLRLLQDALDMVGPGSQEAVSIAFDLRLLTGEMADRLRVRAGEKRVSLECRVHHQVPSRLIGDAGRLRQVLWNLVDHAIDASQPYGLVLRVGRLHEDHDSVTVRFDLRSYHLSQMGGLGQERVPADEPPGVTFPAEVEAASDFKLSIARRVAGLMGGAVHVEGLPEAMEHAWFDLTFGKQPEVPATSVPAPLRESLAGIRVLVVDSNETYRASLVARLEEWGCRTAAVEGSDDAMAGLREASAASDPFGFVLISRDLADGGGEALGQRVRAEVDGPGPLLMLLTDLGCRGDMERARHFGFGAYLSRPIDWSDLAEAMIEMRHRAADAAGGGEPPFVTRHWLAETQRTRTRILVVEDDVVSALVTDWTLRRMGYQVQRVGSAAEVRRLRAEASSWFDLVILALRLPDGDGLSLVGEVRGTSPGGGETAVLVIGFAGTRGERDRCQVAGANAYIASPVDLEHMCQMVEQMTSSGRARGPYLEDPTADGSRPTVRERAQALGMLTFAFDVDPETGVVLSRGQGSAPSLEAATDALIVGSMEELGQEPCVEEPAGAQPPDTEPAGEPPVTGSASMEPAGAETSDMEQAEELPIATSDAAEPVGAQLPAAETAMPVPASSQPAAVGPPRQGRGYASPVIDVEQLDRATLGDVAARVDVLGLFVGRARAGLERLAQAQDAGDAARFEVEAARVVRMAEAIGACACAEVFTALRCAGVAGAAAQPSLVEEASMSVDRVERVMTLVARAAPPDTRAAA